VSIDAGSGVAHVLDELPEGLAAEHERARARAGERRRFAHEDDEEPEEDAASASGSRARGSRVEDGTPPRGTRRATVGMQFDADAFVFLRPEWHWHAACRWEDAALFFPEPEVASNVAKAKVVCASCPVVEPCLRAGLDDATLVGVWGGLTTRERNTERRKPSGRRK
jgi:WhiB family redox-sensing transcriptional regulator